VDEVEFGRYRLLSVIGEGGMGKVYRAHDTLMDRDVAIKVSPPELAADSARASRWAGNGAERRCWSPKTPNPDKRARAAIGPQLGAPFDFLLANGLFLILISWLGHNNLEPDAACPFLT
jgi:serine/threonine protein kinase